MGSCTSKSTTSGFQGRKDFESGRLDFERARLDFERHGIILKLYCLTLGEHDVI
jgi:hypothetical protein